MTNTVYIYKLIFCSLLKPSYDRQVEVLISAIAEVIWRCAGGFAVQNVSCSVTSNPASNVNIPKAIVALPQETSYLQHSVQYFQDGLTETVCITNASFIISLLSKSETVKNHCFECYKSSA